MFLSTFAMISIALLAGCGKSAFTGSPAPSSTRASENANPDSVLPTTPDEVAADSASEASKSEDSKKLDSGATKSTDAATTAGKLDLNLCSKLMAENPDQVIKASQSIDKIVLQNDAIILFDITGPAQIKLEAQDVKSIKGLCVNASGQGTLSINTSLIVGGIYFVGRGSSLMAVDFEKTGLLADMAVDVGGGSQLTVTGDKIDCTKLAATVGGSGNVQCNGAPL